jgi:hypothetical protein
MRWSGPPDSPCGHWTVRPYRPGDEPEILRMFGRVFGRATSPERWRWRFGGAAWSVEPAWVAILDGRPVCHFAAMPTRVQVGGCERAAAAIVDVMTAPDVRRRGLLTEVAQRAMQAWTAAGVSFMYGLPNAQWGSRTTALGIEPVATLRRFVLPLRPQTTLARKLHAPWLARPGWADAAWSRVLDLRLAHSWGDAAWSRAPGRVPDREVSVHAVATAGPEFDALWRACAPASGVTVVRDRERVQWRYLDAPGVGYRVLLASRGDRPVGYAA